MKVIKPKFNIGDIVKRISFYNDDPNDQGLIYDIVDKNIYIEEYEKKMYNFDDTFKVSPSNVVYFVHFNRPLLQHPDVPNIKSLKFAVLEEHLEKIE